MAKLSLKKIIVTAALIIALTNLPQITKALTPVYEWFCDSLSVIRDFPPGMQAAIAVGLIVMGFVTVTKFYLRK